jgi:hypothetical protein
MTEPQLVYRTDNQVSFAVPSTEDAWSAYFSAPSPETADATVDPELLEAVRNAVHGEVAVSGRPASVGRGASAVGAAVMVLVGIGSVGGGVQTIAWAAQLTRAAYRAVRRRLGHRPNVSLGAATYLAAADLCDRIGCDDFVLLGSGDTNSHPPDESFTGDDTFWVVFMRSPDLYVYIVAANGRVHYMGSHEMRAGWQSRLAWIPGPDGRTALPDAEDDEGDSYDGLP